MSLHTVSNGVFRFLQTNPNIITASIDPTSTSEDVIIDPTIFSIASTTSSIQTFIDNTAVLTAISTTTNTVSEQELLSDLQNYVKTTGSNITGIVNFVGDYASITFPDSSQQTTGFTNTKDNILASVNNQTQHITSDARTTYVPIFNC